MQTSTTATARSHATATESTAAQADFRAAMGAIATPVSVVTAYDGTPHGTTVSAFCSLSLEPPMVLISIDNNSELLATLLPTRRFGLNVLAADQADVAMTFATRGIDRFGVSEWILDDGLPRLSHTASWVSCDLSNVISAGDHMILTGRVHHADTALDRPGLTYQHRTFGTHHPH